MTRRAFLTLPAALVTPPNVTGLRVSGRLIEDASDLQVGYFALCRTGTGQCQAKHAIGISVHPQNEDVLPTLQELVGHDVTVSVRPA